LICPLCQQEAKDNKLKETRTLVTCAYCGKEFYKTKSKLDNSKSGLYFCCREHKDLAQRIDFGCVEIQPSHYGKASKDYREKAFREYEHKCSICGWDEDPDILEVHHIDENREHNELSNLVILCPICHRKITSHKYKLIERNSIIPI
jgi:ribosomal protein L37E